MDDAVKRPTGSSSRAREGARGDHRSLAGGLVVFASKALRFDPKRIVGGVPISGVFDLTPLPHYGANVDLRLDDAEARSVSLMQAEAPSPHPRRGCRWRRDEDSSQSRDFAAAAPQARECLLPAGYNHFSILDAFIERGQRLHQATLELFV
jgi:arylformamidase